MLMSTRVKVIMVAGALAVLALVLVVFRSGPPDPFYRGRRLSDYLDGFAGDGMQQNQEPPFGLVIIFQDTTDRRGSAWEALPKFGTNALPFLIKRHQSRDSPFKQWLMRLAGKQSIIKLNLQSAYQKQTAAVVAFTRLGTNARPALPAIVRLLKEPHAARAALYALNMIEADPNDQILAVTNLLTGTGLRIETEAMAVLGNLGTNASGATPALLKELESTKTITRAMAAVALVRIGADGEKVVPLITRYLQQPGPALRYPASDKHMYLWALGQLGPRAREAFPIISNFVNDPDRRISEAAKEALRQVDPKQSQPDRSKSP